MAAAILVTTARESISVSVSKICDRNSKPPFSLSSNACRPYFARYSWSRVRFAASVGLIADLTSDVEGLEMVEEFEWDQALLVRPLLDHFDGLLCGVSAASSNFHWRKEREYGHVRVT